MNALRRVAGLCIALLVSALFGSELRAEVARMEVTSRVPVAGGKAFGKAGAYERIIGRVFFSVDISNPRNRAIVDLDKAANLKDGRVAFSANVIVVQPVDQKLGNGSLLLEVPNRGNARILGLVDGGDQDPNKDIGDAWLLEHGYTVVALGWQWDAVGDSALRLDAPVAKNHGKTITGLVRGDVMPSKVMDDVPLGHLIVGALGGSEYAVASPSDPRNILTVRDSAASRRSVIPRSKWRFARMIDGKAVPSDRHIQLDGGFQPGKLYEYVFVAADPPVAGLGFAAVRDFAAYAKHDPKSLVPAARVYGEGISQNGRFLRQMLYEGFNADEQGRIALDGVLAHVAGAGRGSFNHRFAQPSRDSQPTSSVFFPTDVFPFTDLPTSDPASGAKGGLLDRARADHVVPKIFLSHTSYEYWGRGASLIHTLPDGAADATISPELRIYFFAGLQHFSRGFPPAKGDGPLASQHPQSPLPVRFFWRAMIENMDRWVRGQAEPPRSRYPTLSEGTLVSLSALAFPSMQGVQPPRSPVPVFHLDFGPNWTAGIQTLQPPKVGKPFPVLVPQTDSDGNDLGGIRPPQVQVPLATYTGWNLRNPDIGAPKEMVAFLGSFLPFPRNREDADVKSDPRKPISERYQGRDDYLTRYRTAVEGLVAERYLLVEDEEAQMKMGAREWDYAQSGEQASK
ncbi:MAG: alpha/beta hydrolase domain-containing protein [Myxococcales bacterium]